MDRLNYLILRVLYNSIGIGILLHASGLFAELPVDKPARFVEDVRSTRILVESLGDFSVPIELDVHLLSVTSTERLDHLLYCRAAVNGVALVASFLAYYCLHVAIRQAFYRRLFNWCHPVTIIIYYLLTTLFVLNKVIFIYFLKKIYQKFLLITFKK